jgi:hypothetical protein
MADAFAALVDEKIIAIVETGASSLSDLRTYYEQIGEFLR